MSQARASWRVTGLINPVWQLPDARSGSSPPSLSHSHIPVSRGPITSMIYSLENGECWGNTSELRSSPFTSQEASFILYRLLLFYIIILDIFFGFFGNLLKNHSIWLFNYIIIVGYGSLAIQPEG